MPTALDFLPNTMARMRERGWAEADFVLVSGDAYVDHPSFGPAIISRLLESRGYRVAMLAQPNWGSADAFTEFGRPRLGFLVSAGNLDSMVNHYTANRKPRSTDAYSPGGRAGLRPDRALIAYCNRIRQAYPGVAIALGGLEASLRRLGHYDYWSDSVRKSVLLDSKADILLYGMAERAILELAEGLSAGRPIKELREIRGTVWRCGRAQDIPQDAVALASYEEIKADTSAFAASFATQYRNTEAQSASRLYEASQAGTCVQNPPAPALEGPELDAIYALPYARAWHPDYDSLGGVPALEEVRFSISANRGCFGSCSFCALAFHQGRQVQARSKASILSEARAFSQSPGFKGQIHDVGGPTANFRHPACPKQAKSGTCLDRRCLGYEPCPKLRVDHSEYLDILRALRNLPGVSRVFIRSGIRFDYLMLDKDPSFFRELCLYHVSGQLKVAPEHVSESVLRAMGKSKASAYRDFAQRFSGEQERIGKKQYLLPYYISAHPGCGLAEAIELALELKRSGFVPEQGQDFYPTPGTLSTCMYYTGLDPLSGQPVYVAKGERERRMQRALLHFNQAEQRSLAREALRMGGRSDLIGSSPHCLVPSERHDHKNG